MAEKETGVGFILSIQGSIMAQSKQVEEILACNGKTSANGLTLTEEQARRLVMVRNQTLKKTGRIEFEKGILDKLILTFADSPYLSQDNYEDTLQELVELFYNFKNETDDRVRDRVLLSYMKEAFDEECAGSVELLAGEALPKLVYRVNGQLAERYQIPAQPVERYQLPQDAENYQMRQDAEKYQMPQDAGGDGL